MAKNCFYFLLAAAMITATAHADNWPGWRGPTSNQVATQGDYPTTLNPAKNAVWKIDLPGKGSSTPCVWKGRIFITCDIEGQDGILFDTNKANRKANNKKKLQTANTKKQAEVAKKEADYMKKAKTLVKSGNAKKGKDYQTIDDLNKKTRTIRDNS